MFDLIASRQSYEGSILRLRSVRTMTGNTTVASPAQRTLLAYLRDRNGAVTLCKRR